MDRWIERALRGALVPAMFYAASSRRTRRAYEALAGSLKQCPRASRIYDRAAPRKAEGEVPGRGIMPVCRAPSNWREARLPAAGVVSGAACVAWLHSALVLGCILGFESWSILCELRMRTFLDRGLLP